ncbi:MAG: hypothetical protein LBC84_01560 [Prevotellaceae bacterium]|jgi:hypothetical protein|nr:hypothetical protein [Prevotellaceae bacterium]
MKHRGIYLIVALVLTAIIAFFFGEKYEAKYHPVIIQRVDTLTLTNTIRDTILEPVTVYRHRTDTIPVHVTVHDTLEVVVQLPVPITRKEYETDDYRAVIEGWRPSLIEMEVYQKTHYITNTVTIKSKPRFGVGVQAGVGFSNRAFVPYVGIGVQYNLITF